MRFISSCIIITTTRNFFVHLNNAQWSARVDLVPASQKSAYDIHLLTFRDGVSNSFQIAHTPRCAHTNFTSSRRESRAGRCVVVGNAPR